MKSFSINIETTYNEIKDEGKTPQAFAVFQYPIYCFHCNIISQEPYPLENLDRAIVDCLIQFLGVNITRLSSFLGVEDDVIKFRLEDLYRNGEIDKDASGTFVSNEKSKLFLATAKGQIKRKYRRDFYLNGYNLEPLPTSFYKEIRKLMIDEDDKYYITDGEGNIKCIETFKPDVVYTIPEVEEVKSKILNFPVENRVDYEIPENIIEIENFTFTQLTLPIIAVMSLISKNNLRFDFYNPAIHNPTKITESSISKTLRSTCFNFGIKIDISDSEDAKGNPYRRGVYKKSELQRKTKGKILHDVFIDLRDSILEELLKLEYELENVRFDTNNQKMLEVWIKEKDFINMSRLTRLKIMENLNRTRDYFYSNPASGAWLVFIYFNSECEILEAKRALYSEVFDNWESQRNEYANSGEYHEIRETLYLHGDYVKLEKLDMVKYMTSFEKPELYG